MIKLILEIFVMSIVMGLGGASGVLIVLKLINILGSRRPKRNRDMVIMENGKACLTKDLVEDLQTILHLQNISVKDLTTILESINWQQAPKDKESNFFKA